MEELFQVLDRRILGIFRTKGEIATVCWRLNGRVEFDVAGEAIARAIINKPALLLADEPTGALDSETTADVLQIFDQLNADGMTVVLVTLEHDVAERAKLRVLFRDGRIAN